MTKNIENPFDTYFWLGADGEVTSKKDEKEFNKEIDKARQEREDFLNVKIRND